jgi:hypothetical protein
LSNIKKEISKITLLQEKLHTWAVYGEGKDPKRSLYARSTYTQTNQEWQRPKNTDGGKSQAFLYIISSKNLGTK